MKRIVISAAALTIAGVIVASVWESGGSGSIDLGRGDSAAQSAIVASATAGRMTAAVTDSDAHPTTQTAAAEKIAARVRINSPRPARGPSAAAIAGAVRTASGAAPVALSDAAPVALTFRNGADDDALACARQDDLGVPAGGFKFDAGCVDAYVERICESNAEDVIDGLAAYLRTHPLNVRKGLGRYNVINEAAVGWCDMPAAGRFQAIAIANSPKKRLDQKKAEANQEHLLWLMSEGDGTIDAGGYGKAIEQRNALIAEEEVPAELSALKTAGLPATQAGWTNLTGYVHPVGRVNDLLIDNVGTKDTRTMWAGTDGGGIWKTTDGGASWNVVNDFNGSLSIGKILRSPRNSLEMYASTNPYRSHTFSPFGVMKSNDGGVTWNQLAQTNPGANVDWTYIAHLAIHPTGVAGQDVLLAATYTGNGNNGGVYQSIDSGATWTKISVNNGASFAGFFPGDGNRRAYTLYDGTITITTAGNDWSGAQSHALMAGPSAFPDTKFAYAPSDVNVMYALMTSNTGATTLLRSSNAGSNWSPLTPPANFFYNGVLFYTGALWVDPGNANHIIVAEGWAASTPNATTATAGSGWVQTSVGWTDFHGAFADPGYNGTTNKVVYLTDDGGLYKYADVDAWNSNFGSVLTTGMTITEAYSAAGRGGNIIFGAQDVGGRVYRPNPPSDATNKWRSINYAFKGGDGATMAASRTNSNVLYGSAQYLEMYRSDDGGVTATSICGVVPNNVTEGHCNSNNNTNAPFIAPLVLDPSNSTTMIAGANSLWRSTNVNAATPTWSIIHSVAGAQVRAIAIAPSNSNIIWVVYSTGAVYQTSNGTAVSPTFTAVPAATALSGNKVRILIDRTNTQNVWIGLSGFSANRLQFSNNGGTSFTPVAGLPSASVMALEQHPSNAAWLYAGTAVGLFASQNSGTSWSGSNSEGPANVQIRDLNWYSESGSSADLLVATFGRGIWKATLVNSTPTLTVTIAGSGAGTVTTVPPGIPCGAGCQTYASGTPVTVTALATAGSVFTGWLGACVGTLPCVLTISAATNVSATFAPGGTIPRVDVDANNSYSALTDGLLLLRYLFGVSGPQLVASVIGPGATRSSDTAISQHLTNIKPVLDVDGNGQADALTDGLLLIRYMFGLRGATLIQGAIGTGATRTTSMQIENYLASILQ